VHRLRRVTGVQHPAPTLFCTCDRTPDALVVGAPFAMAVLNGKNITHDPGEHRIAAVSPVSTS
jgi:hypothetical protein